jgi:pilus assembly protein Flp/PilA
MPWLRAGPASTREPLLFADPRFGSAGNFSDTPRRKQQPRGAICIKNSFKEIAMNALRNHLNRFMCEEDGATMVEYGLMVALIAVVCIGAVTLLGTSLSTLFGGVQTSLPATS